MPSLTKKIVRRRPYHYLRECQRVHGKPKIACTILPGLPGKHPRAPVASPARGNRLPRGGSVAAFSVAQALDVVATIDRQVHKRGHQGPSVGQYLLLAALNRCVRPTSKARIAAWYENTVLRRLLLLTANQLSSQRFWDNMERVNQEQIRLSNRN